MSGYRSERLPDGAIIVDGIQIADTKQCCHCGHHFLSIRGSGKTRGWCMKCNAVTCGRPTCNTCYPFQKRLADYERGQLETLD